MEIWSSRDVYVWHWFAGRSGTNNALTVVDYSPLCTEILSGKINLLFEYGIKFGCIEGV